MGKTTETCRCYYGNGARRQRKKYILMDIGRRS